MNTRLAYFSTPLLRWTLGLVVILESFLFVFSAPAAHFLAKAGLPPWIQPVLGGAEILAAVLFLVPLTIAIGGFLLLVIFAFAVLLHILHGQLGQKRPETPENQCGQRCEKAASLESCDHLPSPSK